MNVSRSCRRLSASIAMLLAMAIGADAGAQSKTERPNIVQLISSSQSIVSGTVSKVSDGIDANGLPYTEVTLLVGASAKGSIGQGAYTFRQFGLLKPRTMPNGHRMLMVTPAEFPQWRENEQVVAFLYHPAAKTGLQTTSGLAHGKLVLVNGKLVNQYDNAGLFDRVSAAKGVLSANEQKVLDSKGPVNATDLMSLINHVVRDRLVEKGVVQ